MENHQNDFNMMFDVFESMGHHLPQQAKDDIMASTQIKEYKKNETILRYGDYCDSVSFIVEGVAMIKYEADEDRELVEWIMKEGDVFISVQSYCWGIKSIETIVALENTRCIVLPKTMVKTLSKKYEAFNILESHLLEHYHAKSDVRKKLNDKSAANRYEYLLKNEPWLFDRVSDFVMAHYLKMTEQTFSKIKKGHQGNSGT